MGTLGQPDRPERLSSPPPLWVRLVFAHSGVMVAGIAEVEGGRRSSLARPGVRRGCAGSWILSPGHRPPLEVCSLLLQY